MKITVKMDDRLHAEIQIAARLLDTTMSSIVAHGVRLHLEGLRRSPSFDAAVSAMLEFRFSDEFVADEFVEPT